MIRVFTHDAKIFSINDRVTFELFLKKYGIKKEAPFDDKIRQVGKAFSCLPYENLTKIIKAGTLLNPRSAMRLPDEVLSDHLKWGCGGTCFSLTAAAIAVLGALGIEAHPILADRHYGPDTHCGLVIIKGKTWLLLDPGYLLFIPVSLPETESVYINTSHNTIELKPINEGKRIELTTIVKGNRKLRLTYKRDIVSPERFEKAWITSFTWEMMTYPVLTRYTADQHIYIQGNMASIRSSAKTTKVNLDPYDQFTFIKDKMGISEEIIKKALEILHYGRTIPTITC
ncbi:MAG: hypothetical protein N2053_07230 [Chitinispirillaceae bacterium]|nr:hypothetical protein [Chitinispirillaceae bacterium]